MRKLQRLIVGRASALVSLLVLGFGILLIVGLGQATHTPAVTDEPAPGLREHHAPPSPGPAPRGGLLDRRGAVHERRGRRSTRPTSASSAGGLRPRRRQGHGPQRPAGHPQRGRRGGDQHPLGAGHGPRQLSDVVTDLRRPARRTVPDGVRAEVTGPGGRSRPTSPRCSTAPTSACWPPPRPWSRSCW